MGLYAQQKKQLRKLAISVLGVDKVVGMTDYEIEIWAENNYICLYDDESKDEFIYLIPKDKYDEIEEDIVFLTR